MIDAGTTKTTTHGNAARPQDAEIGRVMETYLAALEAGEPVDRKAWLARFPQWAEALSPMLEQLEALHGMAVRVADGEEVDTPAGDAPPPQLGEFRIVREVGRGGMGIVYEAEQTSLGRRVALKVLPFAAMLDQRQLTRFKNEARAAATLDHPHIVSVHSVGCERGVHYYAMQFVDGYSLAQVIVALRAQNRMRANDRDANDDAGTPLSAGGEAQDATCDWPLSPDASHSPQPPASSPSGATAAETVAAEALATILSEHRDNPASHYRNVARIGIQAAEALQHAHERGVVHRDIKPANLMLDANGEIWVTDFGLARLEADAGMTMTGDVVGTLRYMSPEQIQGKPAVVDHRTDIYSLGATLYELATTQPPFDGEDRQTLAQQVSGEEPRFPRGLGPGVPKALKTIVLKAMSKSPADRYATAQELADDLRRFIEDKPIVARRPSILDRAAKWSRRHRGAVAAAMLLLLLATIGSSVAALYISESQQAEQAARIRAQDNLEIALTALDEVYAKLVNEVLPAQQTLSDTDRRIMESIITIYKSLAEANVGNPDLEEKVYLAYFRVGMGASALDMHEDAAAAFRNAARVVEQRLDRDPTDGDSRANLMYACLYWSRSLRHPSQKAEVLKLLQKAIDIGEVLYAEGHRPEWVMNHLRECYYAYCNAVVIPVARLNRGYVGEWDPTPVRRQLDRAIELGTALVQRFPDNSSYRESVTFPMTLAKRPTEEIFQILGPVDILRVDDQEFLGSAQGYAHVTAAYADELRKQHRIDEAIQMYEKAIAISERGIQLLPLVEVHHEALCGDLEKLGRLYERTVTPPQADKAAACYGRVLEVAEDYVARRRNLPVDSYIEDCVKRTLGRLTKMQDTGVAESVFRNRAAKWELLARVSPTDVDARKQAILALVPLAEHLQQRDQDAAGEAAWLNSLDLTKKLVQDFPDDLDARRMLWQRYVALAVFYHHRNQPTDAAAAIAEAAAAFERAWTMPANVAADQGSLHALITGATIFVESANALDNQVLAVDHIRRCAELATDSRDAFDVATTDPENPTVSLSELRGFLAAIVGLANQVQKSDDEETAQEVRRTARMLLVSSGCVVPRLPYYRDMKDVLGDAEVRRLVIDVYEDLRVALVDARLKSDSDKLRQRFAQTSIGLHALLVHGNGATVEDEQRAKAILDEALASYGATSFASLSELDQKLVTNVMAHVGELLGYNPDPAPGDFQRALELTKERMRLSAKSAREGSRTHAVALFRNDQHAAAVAEFERNVNGGKGADPEHLICWAMALWHVGDQDAARQKYEQSLAAMDKRGIASARFERLRAEAQSLLQIDDAPATATVPAPTDGNSPSSPTKTQ